MKRFHVHLVVKNLETSIHFYSKLFGHRPTKQKDDYAKWMLNEPAVNFAISSRGNMLGINHFGFQVETPIQLEELKIMAEEASAGDVYNQGQTICCYANSDKHWTKDSEGIEWENFLTLADDINFSSEEMNACCTSDSQQNHNNSCG